MRRVFFTAAARTDLDDALAWYGARSPEAGAQFQDALRAVIFRIRDNPKQFPASPHRTRRALLRRFPETRAAVYVVAVFHTSRNPKTWQRRTS
jgi:plasmid stabilization system protein ParE